MIDPVLFSFKLFALQITLTWYGLIVMTGVLVGGWIAEREVRRRGENGEVLLDAMVWAVIVYRCAFVVCCQCHHRREPYLY